MEEKKMKKSMFELSIVLVCGLMILGCWNKDGKTASEAPKGSLEQTKTSNENPDSQTLISEEDLASLSSSNTKEGSMTVVTINDKEIARSEVDQALEFLLMQYRGRIPPEQMSQAKPALWKQAMENLINQNLLLQEADKGEIQADKKDVDTRLEEISKRFPNPEEFQKMLDSMGMSDQDFRGEIDQNLKIEKLLSENLGESKEVTEEEIKSFYSENPENFQMPDKVRASHILITVEPEDKPEDKAQKRLEISRLKGQIDKGEDFATLAGQHSSCPSKSRGGDLGYFEKGKMVKPFEDAAFQMKTGEVSDVVETQFGFHLIKVTDHQKATVVPLEQAHDKITSFLEGQKKEQAVGDYLGKLRGEAKISYAEGVQP